MSRKRDHEKALFQAFVETEPEFSGERLASWEQPQDEREFPDIRAKSMSGRRVGVELAEWLNQEEIAAAMDKERREKSILEAIGDQGSNPTQHIDHVWLLVKPRARVKLVDAAAFRTQLLALIAACERRWPTERFWRRGHQVSGPELDPYPVLARYLNGVRLWPKGDWPNGVPWILFPARGGFFNRDTMLDPLKRVIAEKINHYASGRTGFDDLTLLVIYNRAVIYNSPADSPLYTYDEAAADVGALVKGNPGPFDRILLFLAFQPGGRMLRVFQADRILRGRSPPVH
jgi:hypothetical protein